MLQRDSARLIFADVIEIRSVIALSGTTIYG